MLSEFMNLLRKFRVKRFGILANFIRFITVTCTRHNPWFSVPIRFPWSK